MSPRWEHFSHGADIGIRGFGGTLAQAFEQAATAMIAVITDPAGVCPNQEVVIECTAPDVEILLAEFLNRLIYEMAVRNMLFGRFELRIDGTQLRAHAWGEAVVAGRHCPAVEIKGATYTELCVARDEQGEWRAQTVVDV